MPTAIDQQLLSAAQRGDSIALERIVELSKPDVKKYVRRFCEASEAEDAVQDSLIILYRHGRGLRSAAALASWLFQVVKRECQRLSSRMFRKSVSLDDIAERELLSTHTDIDLRLDIAMAIQSLPDIYREAIVLRDFEELTVAEIATRLGVNFETVKTRLRRGRQLIREHLVACEVQQ